MARWSHHRLRPWTAGGAVLLACALLVSASGAPEYGWEATTAHRGGRDVAVRVLQMNLCDSGVAGCYTGRSVAEASGVLRTERPDVVTLNEVCRGDVAVLEQALAGTDRAGVVVSAFRAAGDRRTGGDYHCRNGQPYGIGVIARLGPSGGYATSSGIYPMQDTYTPEERAWLCLRPTAPGASLPAACTTHLTNASPATARAQCDYLLGTAVPDLRGRGATVPVVLGGDFNLHAGGSPDVQSCVPVGDRRTGDGIVQHVVVTPEFAITSRRMITMHATDHPGLLVTLVVESRPPTAVEAQGRDAVG